MLRHPHLTNADPMTTAEPWVSDDEDAKHLGAAKVSVYRWFDTRSLPVRKDGRLWDFNLSVVADWVRTGGVDAHQHDSRKGGAR